MDFVAFSIANINIYWYGIIIAAALVVALGITKLNCNFHHEEFTPIIELFVWAIPIGIIGARVVYLIQHPNNYKSFASIFHIWQGGLSIYGAAIALCILSLIYFKLKDLDIWYWLDLLVPAIMLVITVMQITNFVLQLSIGAPFGPDLPNDHRLAEYIEFKYRPTGFENYQYFQPVAIYQAAASLAIFVLTLLLTLLNRYWHFLANGTLLLIVIFLVASTRFWAGFMYLAVDKTDILHPAQWVSLGFIGLTIIGYVIKKWRSCKLN